MVVDECGTALWEIYRVVRPAFDGDRAAAAAVTHAELDEIVALFNADASTKYAPGPNLKHRKRHVMEVAKHLGRIQIICAARVAETPVEKHTAALHLWH